MSFWDYVQAHPVFAPVFCIFLGVWVLLFLESVAEIVRAARKK